jgi:hypothetical protein
MSTEFYAVSAQVLPVLFLAAAVEFRLLQLSEEDVRSENPQDRAALIATNIVGVVGFVLTAAIGEAAALRVVAEQAAVRYADVMVVGALIVSGLALLVVPAMNMLALLARVNRVEKEEQAREAGGTYVHQVVGAEWWATLIGAVLLVALYAIPVYSLIQLVRVVL